MKLFVQITFIILAFTYIILVYFLRFAPPGNIVDHAIRPTLLHASIARRLFFLYRVSDTRYQLASTQAPLTIQVWHPSGIIPNPQLSTWLETMITQTLNRSTTVSTHPFSQVPSNSLSDGEINDLIKSLPDRDRSAINLIYLPGSQSAPTNAGQAVTDSTMLIFYATIASLSDRSHIQEMIEQSTIMHEWGHLLGLDHIDQEDCIMNEKVEVYGNRRFQGSNLPTDYCPEELFQLSHLLP